MENLTKMIVKIFDEEYKKANFAEAQKLAYDVIQKSGFSELPINIKKLIKKYKSSGLHIQTYTSFARQQSLELNDVIYLTDSKDGCLWKRKYDTYILLYNDTIAYQPTVRFTLAHELGHFILRHHNQTEGEILSRGTLSKSTHKYFEMEANYFAKRLLAPIPLVDIYTKKWDMIDDQKITKIFGVSSVVSESIIKSLISRAKNTNILLVSHEMVKNFKKLLTRNFHIKSV